MGMMAKARAFIAKHVTEDRDHGGWIQTTWPLNYWQSGRTTDGGRNNIVYACVQAYAQTIAQLPAYHKRTLDNGGSEIVRTSAASRVLRKPNPYQTRSDFLLNLIWSLLYSGNAYALAIRNDRFEISELHGIDPSRVTPNVLGGEVYYSVAMDEVSGQEGATVIPARDILHVKLYTPNHKLHGETPITAASMAIGTNNAIMNQQAAFFSNMSRPSGIITSDEKLDAEQTAALRERWDQMAQGINNGKVPILSWGLKWQQLSMNSTDAQLLESLKFSVKDIARAYRVPLPLIGEEEQATYNNVYNLMSFWKASGLGFVLEHCEQAMTALFRLPPGEKIELDTDSLLRTDMQARIDALTKGITGGLYSPNEARALEGLQAVEGGESPRVQQQMIPLDYEEPEPEPVPVPMLEAEPEPDPEDEDEDDEQERSLTPEQQAVLAKQMIEQAML